MAKKMYRHACRTRGHSEICASTEFSTQHTNNLDYSTWALKKENFKNFGLRELRLHCISLLHNT